MLTLETLYPRYHQRYAALPVLGSIVVKFVRFLDQRGHHRDPIRERIRTLGRFDRQLQEAGCRTLAEVTRELLARCSPPSGRSRDDPHAYATARRLDEFLTVNGHFVEPPLTGPALLVREYAYWLRDTRGFTASTVRQHTSTASEFLDLVEVPLGELSSRDIEQFQRTVAPRMSRPSMQHVVAHLRSFLRYLTNRGLVPRGLDQQIDTPLVWRGERLPRALPWASVEAMLEAVDRRTIKGRRDYAMLMLIATYGLRACEIAGLTFDDFRWRSDELHVPQRKTGATLVLPVTRRAGDALIDWLRVRPAYKGREVFVRLRSPSGGLQPTALADVFAGAASRAGLDLPGKSVHRLRHSFAVHLLRQGVAVKTIGDLLGHRTTESTGVYLRLAIEDLRDVSPGLPAGVEVPR